MSNYSCKRHGNRVPVFVHTDKKRSSSWFSRPAGWTYSPMIACRSSKGFCIAKEKLDSVIEKWRPHKTEIREQSCTADEYLRCTGFRESLAMQVFGLSSGIPMKWGHETRITRTNKMYRSFLNNVRSLWVLHVNCCYFLSIGKVPVTGRPCVQGQKGSHHSVHNSEQKKILSRTMTTEMLQSLKPVAHQLRVV